VATRILRGEAISAADYIDLLDMRKSLIARATVRLAPYDAACAADHRQHAAAHRGSGRYKAFTAANLLALRELHADQHDRRLALFHPLPSRGDVPVGLMLAAAGGSDRDIFELAAEWRLSFVFDLGFTIDARGATTPLMLPIDQP